ncbi:MAG: hypothetical protein Roseis2KO_03090 [Roseivirga sp.]
MQPSRIVYFEIPATQPEACMHFYKKVFGWQFGQTKEEPYWLAKTGPDTLPGINGAITASKEGLDTVVNTILVQNLEETMTAIVHHGGEVCSAKQNLKGIGQMVCFKDTEGHLHRALETNGRTK